MKSFGAAHLISRSLSAGGATNTFRQPATAFAIVLTPCPNSKHAPQQPCPTAVHNRPGSQHAISQHALRTQAECAGLGSGRLKVWACLHINIEDADPAGADHVDDGLLRDAVSCAIERREHHELSACLDFRECSLDLGAASVVEFSADTHWPMPRAAAECHDGPRPD